MERGVRYMEILHVLIGLLVWYIKLVKSTLPVLQLSAFTFISLATAAFVLYLVSLRRRNHCHDVC